MLQLDTSGPPDRGVPWGGCPQCLLEARGQRSDLYLRGQDPMSTSSCLPVSRYLGAEPAPCTAAPTGQGSGGGDRVLVPQAPGRGANSPERGELGGPVWAGGGGGVEGPGEPVQRLAGFPWEELRGAWQPVLKLWSVCLSVCRAGSLGGGGHGGGHGDRHPWGVGPSGPGGPGRARSGKGYLELWRARRGFATRARRPTDPGRWAAGRPRGVTECLQRGSSLLPEPAALGFHRARVTPGSAPTTSPRVLPCVSL